MVSYILFQIIQNWEQVLLTQNFVFVNQSSEYPSFSLTAANKKAPFPPKLMSTLLDFDKGAKRWQALGNTGILKRSSFMVAHGSIVYQLLGFHGSKNKLNSDPTGNVFWTARILDTEKTS